MSNPGEIRFTKEEILHLARIMLPVQWIFLAMSSFIWTWLIPLNCTQNIIIWLVGLSIPVVAIPVALRWTFATLAVYAKRRRHKQS